MTVTLETCRDVRLSADAFWRIVDDARLATSQDLFFRKQLVDAVDWQFFANGTADLGDPYLAGPITATVTRD